MREEHERAWHIVYRTWCDACVRARGQAMGHVSDTGREYEVPQLGADYWFAGGTEEDRRICRYSCFTSVR